MSAWKKFFQPYHDWRWGVSRAAWDGKDCFLEAIAVLPWLPLPRVSSEAWVGVVPFIMARVCCQSLLLCGAVGICLGVVLLSRSACRTQPLCSTSWCPAWSCEQRSKAVFILPVPHFRGNYEGIQRFKAWKGFRPSCAFILDSLICDSSRRYFIKINQEVHIS